MPRFHFNVVDGVTETDREGVQLADAREARSRGLRLAGELLAEEADSENARTDWSLEITDGRGMILFRIDILLSQSAAMG